MAKNEYPSTYGRPTKGALPDILGPLNIEGEGDRLTPANDMAEIGMASGSGVKDPLDLIPARDGSGKK